MKKLLSALLGLLLLFSLVSCHTAADKISPYPFLSEKERLSWKDQIITVLSNNKIYESMNYGCRGVALMDLNFDSTPELLVTYAGGSMGNVCVVVYDLLSGEELNWNGVTPHYENGNTFYLCMYSNNDGGYTLLNQGALRDGLEWYETISTSNEILELDVLFEEVFVMNESKYYYCDGNEVDQAEFEQQKKQFFNDHKEIPETRVQIFYWSDLKSETEIEALAEIADALVNSEQQFLDFRQPNN